MTKMEFKSIDLMSVFKLFAGLSFVVGFIFALFGAGLNEQFAYALKSIPFVGSMLTGFVGAIVFGLISAIFSGLYFVIIAALYNLFAMIFGGIEFDVDE